MNDIIWKLLRQHISKGQLIGFAIANLIGLTIVLLAVQFYRDVRPVFNDEESFISKDYLIRIVHITLKQSLLTPNTFHILRLWRINFINQCICLIHIVTIEYHIYTLQLLIRLLR